METLIAGAERLGLNLTPQQVEAFQLYREELLRWNRRVNLTAIVGYREVQVRHFLDSLTVAPLVGDKASRLLDIGSGAGFPGLPLKIVHPGIELTLVDSVHKKADFLHHLVERLALDGVEVVAERVESLAHDSRYRQRFDTVVSRAVAALATLAELALPFCTVGGTFIAMKKGHIDSEVAAASAAIDILGGRLREIRGVDIEEFAGERRSLVVIEKLAPSPQRYPRRAGVPQKRPLQ